MIDNLYFKNLTNGEFLQFMRDVEKLYQLAGHSTLTPFLTPLSDALNDLSVAFRAEQGNLLTRDIKELDKRRDNAVRGIKKLAYSYTFHYDPLMQRAAELILRSMNNYSKNIDKLSYNAQTISIAKLIKEWNTDPILINAITLLHLQDWKQELSTVNTAFQNTYMDRIQDEAAKKVVSFSKQREPVTAIYENLNRFAIAYANIDPATYTPLIKKLNELIEKYRV